VSADLQASTPASKAADDTDALIDQAAVPSAVKGGGIGLAGAGLMVLIVGLQAALIGNLHAVLKVSGYAMLATGIASIVVGMKLARGREWALTPSLGLAAALLLGSGTYFVWSFMHGIVSLLALLAVGGAATAAILVTLAWGPFQRLRLLRQKLRLRGIELDFDH